MEVHAARAPRILVVDDDASVRAFAARELAYCTGLVDTLFDEKTTLGAHEAFVEKPLTMQGLLEAVSLLLLHGDLRHVDNAHPNGHE